MTDTNDKHAADHKAQQEAQKKREDEARKRITAEREARDKASKEAPTQVKPTPTQEENDLAASGVHLSEHEPDGSPEQSTAPHGGTLDKEAKPAAPKPGYSTRSSQPA